MHEKLPAGRFLTWALESRTRYALVLSALNALVILGILVLSGSISVTRALLVAIPAVLIGAVVRGWIWYPKARQRLITPHR